MSGRDVLKSLVHRAAVGASTTSSQVLRSRWATEVKHRLSNLYPFQATLTDEDLARAVGQVADIVAVTVHIQPHGIFMHIEDRDGRAQSLELRLGDAYFAPRGAKELTFVMEPAEFSSRSLATDIVAAIAGEVAWSIWRPLLPRQTRPPLAGAQVHRVDGHLVADLRSIPEVRRACSHPLTANLIDALGLTDVRQDLGRMVLRLALPPI